MEGGELPVAPAQCRIWARNFPISRVPQTSAHSLAPRGSAGPLTLACQRTQPICTLASRGGRGCAGRPQLSPDSCRRAAGRSAESRKAETPSGNSGLRPSSARARRLTPKGPGVNSKRFEISIGSASFSIPPTGRDGAAINFRFRAWRDAEGYGREAKWALKRTHAGL